MAEVTAALIKELRERSGAGMMDCKKALVDHDGDIKKALEFLQVKGIASASKGAGRSGKEGVVGSYVHHDGKTAVLVEVNCETDFVARTDDFKLFAKQLAMHICANSPLVVKSDDLDPKIVEEQKNLFVKKSEESGKPAEIAAKIAEGSLNKWLKEVSLLDQPFLLDTTKTVEQARIELSAKTGENVLIGKFAKITVGEVSE